MDRLKAMATFVRIVDAGSLSAAAEAAGQSAAAVVRGLAMLERQLGVRLLNRNTRRMALTDEGAEYLGWCRRMLAEFEAMEQGLDARRQAPAGLLRLTAPVEFGQRYLAPLVAQFLAEQPGLRVELLLLDRVVDLLDEGLDLALRIGRLPDSSLVTRPLGRTRMVVCASPAFVQQHGAVETPQALRGLPCIEFLPQGRQWPFRASPDVGTPLERPASDGRDTGAVPAETVLETVEARFLVNQVQAARSACVQGLGIARLLHYQVADELAAGRLLRLLRPYEPADLPIQLLLPHARLVPPRVRLFIDWAAPRLAQAIPDPAAA